MWAFTTPLSKPSVFGKTLQLLGVWRKWKGLTHTSTDANYVKVHKGQRAAYLN